ncbi:MAG: AAA family ATPase [Planctomycetes bacterium]|nr:AAA family ATPase [Planctomycetota bacterium]
MGQALDKVTIKGFKSIKSLEDFELKNLNVMIGGNGAGKSNFVDIFRMLRAMVDGNFANFIASHGGADDFMFNGPKQTEKIEAQFTFGGNSYSFEMEPTTSEKMLINWEQEEGIDGDKLIMNPVFESMITTIKNDDYLCKGSEDRLENLVYQSISSWCVYHFHDTGEKAPMRRSEITADNTKLRSNASNIAPFLLNLRDCRDGKESRFDHSGDSHTKISGDKSYNEIVDAVRLVTPFFDDFILRPKNGGQKEKVNLSWKQKGSDYPMQPYHFSDGTLRFICLATALLQPILPSTIVIDEPELGLHPCAIDILAELINAASTKTQVIVSTQSPALVDCFQPEDVIVVKREKGASTFRRLKSEDLSEWLTEYSLGELWRKNVVRGGPVHE